MEHRHECFDSIYLDHRGTRLLSTFALPPHGMVLSSFTRSSHFAYKFVRLQRLSSKLPRNNSRRIHLRTSTYLPLRHNCERVNPFWCSCEKLSRTGQALPLWICFASRRCCRRSPGLDPSYICTGVDCLCADGRGDINILGEKG